jgi:hypothetical protein
MELVNSHKQISSAKPLLEAQKKELAKNKQALERLFVLWEEGNFERIFLERKATREDAINKLHEEIKELCITL